MRDALARDRDRSQEHLPHLIFKCFVRVTCRVGLDTAGLIQDDRQFLLGEEPLCMWRRYSPVCMYP